MRPIRTNPLGSRVRALLLAVAMTAGMSGCSRTGSKVSDAGGADKTSCPSGSCEGTLVVCVCVDGTFNCQTPSPSVAARSGVAAVSSSGLDGATVCQQGTPCVQGVTCLGNASGLSQSCVCVDGGYACSTTSTGGNSGSSGAGGRVDAGGVMGVVCQQGASCVEGSNCATSSGSSSQ